MNALSRFHRFTETIHCNYYLEVCALIILTAITVSEIITIFFDAAIELFKNLNIPIVIEGVEREDQLKLSINKEIDYIQGYYFSEPLREGELLTFLKEKNA